MREEDMKTTVALGIIGIFIISTALGAVWYRRLYSKFEVGDCVREVFSFSEFKKPTVYHYKIMKVGREQYLTSYIKSDSLYIFEDNIEFKYQFNKYDKVDDKYCAEIP